MKTWRITRSQHHWYFRVIIVLVFLSILTACNYRQGWVEVTYRDRMRATYTFFDGQHGTSLDLSAGETVTVFYTLEVAKGCLTLQILDPSRDMVWEGAFQEDSSGSFSFPVKIDGLYRLVVNGDETGGGFDLSWDITEND